MDFSVFPANMGMTVVKVVMTVTAGGAWLLGRRFPSEGRPVADSDGPWPSASPS